MVPRAQLHGLLGSSIRGMVEPGRTVRTALCARRGIPRFEDRASKSPGKFSNTAFFYTVTLTRNKIRNIYHLYYYYFSYSTLDNSRK